MTYRQFNKDTDTLEVGTKIRLAGREGEIVKLDAWGKTHTVRWPMPDTGSEQELYLAMFDFEIAVITPKPLTIDKRVKGEILEIIQDEDIYPSESLTAITAYLNSLEET